LCRRRHKHDLRHTFGSLSITVGSTRDVQEWLGHADARTTARYVHYRKRSDEAQRLAGAFAIAVPETEGTNAASEA
jgi:integrase